MVSVSSWHEGNLRVVFNYYSRWVSIVQFSGKGFDLLGAIALVLGKGDRAVVRNRVSFTNLGLQPKIFAETRFLVW